MPGRLLNGVLFVGYIVLGHRLAARGAANGIANLGAAMAVALLFVLPFGFGEAMAAFSSPLLLGAAIGVGICSSVIPYICDQLAMSRLPRASFALMLSLLPLSATLIGVVVLAQIPSVTDLAGIALVVIGVAIHKPAPQPVSEVGDAVLTALTARQIATTPSALPAERIGFRQRQRGDLAGDRRIVEIARPDDVALLSRRIAAGHPEIARPVEPDVADAGRNDAGIAGLDIDLDAAVAAKADPRPARYAGQHLMAARMEMPVRQHVADPGSLPAIFPEQRACRRAVTRFAQAAGLARTPAAAGCSECRHRDRNGTARLRLFRRRRRRRRPRCHASFSLKKAMVRPQARSAAALL